jgi:hypothetical protein
VAALTVIVTDAAGASASNSFVIGVAPSTTPLIATGAVWKFNDTGANLGTAWRATNFNDSGWSSGPSMLGFGDANGLLPTTVIASNRQITTYFRATCVAPPGGNPTNLALRILRDDGAVVYLNGAEIWRDTNMPSGAIAYNTAALSGLNGSAESTWLTANLAPGLLRPGTNWLAVEIHQNSTTSSDVSFNFEFFAQRAATQPALGAQSAAGQLELSWPGWAAGYALQSATNLASPIAWTLVTNTPVLISNEWRVTLPATPSGQRFFRLQTP